MNPKLSPAKLESILRRWLESLRTVMSGVKQLSELNTPITEAKFLATPLVQPVSETT